MITSRRPQNISKRQPRRMNIAWCQSLLLAWQLPVMQQQPSMAVVICADTLEGKTCRALRDRLPSRFMLSQHGSFITNYIEVA